MSSTLKASHEGHLPLGKWDVMAYVLESDPPLRVVTRSDAGAILSTRLDGKFQKRLAALTRHPALQAAPFIKSKIDVNTQIKFLRKDGSPSVGMSAEDLVELCRFLLKAREYGLLFSKDERVMAQAAEALIVSIAKVGLTALIDEATGYQQERSRDALQKLLDKYLRKELASWAKRFPDEFYIELFRLRGWNWKGMQVNRPSVVGTYTRDIVYARIAPGVLSELERLNPRRENGSRKAKHHQWMTDDIGHPALNNHLQGVLAIMRASSSWAGFNRLLKKAFPRVGDQLDLLDLDESDLD